MPARARSVTKSRCQTNTIQQNTFQQNTLQQNTLQQNIGQQNTGQQTTMSQKRSFCGAGSGEKTERGQAIVEYALVTLVLLLSVVAVRATVGKTLWDELLRQLGLYASYQETFDTILSLPFP